MPPRIGITTKTNDKAYQDRWFHNYWWAILWAGGDPVVLTPETAHLPPEEQVSLLDGLFLPGGGDVHPRHYGEPIRGSDPQDIHEGRDGLELSLARAALAANIPVLGVCRGMQVLNIAAGGGLVQHVAGHRPPEGQVGYHEVEIAPDTLLGQVLGVSGRLPTNTYHHQAVTAEHLAASLRPAASTLDGTPLLEALEGTQWRWVLAVQWHPERFFELDPRHRRLFSEFVAVADGR